MSHNNEDQKQLRDKFFNELLPSWDFDSEFLEMGKKLLDKGEYKEARNIFYDILFISPDNTEARKCLEETLAFTPGDEEIESELIRSTGARIFRVIMDGVSNFICWTGQKRIFSLVDIKEAIVISGKKILGEIRTKEAIGLSDDYGAEIIHEGDNFILEVKRGVYEDKLIIRPKE